MWAVGGTVAAVLVILADRSTFRTPCFTPVVSRWPRGFGHNGYLSSPQLWDLVGRYVGVLR